MATPQTRFSSADRREQILDVATGLFAQQGFQGTTTKLIAEKSGVTEALIFRHFSSKEDLYWAVIERKIDDAAPLEHLIDNLEAGGTDLDILTRVAVEVLERRARDGTLSRLLLYSALEEHELSERFFRNYIANYFGVLARFVREGIAAGRFRKVDPLLAARGFMGMVVYHSWIQELYGGNKVQEFDSVLVSRTLARIWLQGVQAEKRTTPVRRKILSPRKRRKHQVK
ncbi:MAG TPA: TetR/AcrR family transcriptional regulator [Terriglobales bacterium]|nr:TetR/AcrR family transcriptional regulator [Terriglobales bacterium]